MVIHCLPHVRMGELWSHVASIDCPCWPQLYVDEDKDLVIVHYYAPGVAIARLDGKWLGRDYRSFA